MQKLANKVAPYYPRRPGTLRSIALAMAREGAHIVICDINPDSMAEAVKEIEAEGVRALGVRCDVSSVESVEHMFAQTKEPFEEPYISSSITLQ